MIAYYCICHPGGVLHPFTWTVGKKREPLAAVLISWLFVQVCCLCYNVKVRGLFQPWACILLSHLLWYLAVQATLFVGQLNSIAPIVTMFFLVSYCVVNLACLALKLAAAPNFRLSEKFLIWFCHHCVLPGRRFKSMLGTHVSTILSIHGTSACIQITFCVRSLGSETAVTSLRLNVSDPKNTCFRPYCRDLVDPLESKNCSVLCSLV